MSQRRHEERMRSFKIDKMDFNTCRAQSCNSSAAANTETMRRNCAAGLFVVEMSQDL